MDIHGMQVGFVIGLVVIALIVGGFVIHSKYRRRTLRMYMSNHHAVHNRINYAIQRCQQQQFEVAAEVERYIAQGRAFDDKIEAMQNDLTTAYHKLANQVARQVRRDSHYLRQLPKSDVKIIFERYTIWYGAIQALAHVALHAIVVHPNRH